MFTPLWPATPAGIALSRDGLRHSSDRFGRRPCLRGPCLSRSSAPLHVVWPRHGLEYEEGTQILASETGSSGSCFVL